jgi:hypothetical protein
MTFTPPYVCGQRVEFLLADYDWMWCFGIRCHGKRYGLRISLRRRPANHRFCAKVKVGLKRKFKQAIRR